MRGRWLNTDRRADDLGIILATPEEIYTLVIDLIPDVAGDHGAEHSDRVPPRRTRGSSGKGSTLMQLINGRSFGPEADTWALGCVMAEMLAGEPLFTATTEEDMLAQVTDLHDDLVTMGVEAFDGVLELSTAGREVLAGLLSYDSWERLTAADALKHRWFAEEDDEEAKAPADVETLYPGFVPLFAEA